MSDISNAKSSSTTSFVAAIIFNSAVFGAEILVFTFLRPRFKAIYEPRTYVPVLSKRVEQLGGSLFAWPLAVYRADYRTVIRYNGLDAYFFLRYLRMMVRILLPVWLLSWAVLLPITIVNSSVEGHTGLDRFTFGNVGSDQQKRYIAHIILVYIFTFWIFYNIRSEMSHFITARQKFLISPTHASSEQAKTLLVTGIPRKYLTERALHKLFGDLPGGIKRIWISRNLRHLPDVYERQLAACGKLESAETKLLALATKAYRKRAASGDAPNTDAGAPVPDDAEPHKKSTKPSSDTADLENPPADNDNATLDTLVPRAKRPTHRLGFLGLVGKKVDTIEWARDEISTCATELRRARHVLARDDGEGRGEADASGRVSVDGSLVGSDDEHAEGRDLGNVEAGKTGVGAKTTDGDGPAAAGSHDDYPVLNAAFIVFNKQIAAHIGRQVLAHHEPYRMVDRYTEVSPEDIVWSNLGLNPYEMRVRKVISYAATAGLIILWSFPVAAIGIISNIAGLCRTYKWLRWICKIPAPIIGIIQGILPPVLLVVLMLLLPIILRLLGRFEGIPKRTEIELSLMTRFFIFQVIHSFLIVTLASGIIAALPQIVQNPSSIATLLAQNLPKASTFFLTYVVLQGLSGTAGGFLQAISLVLYYVKLFLLGSTPRSVYEIKYGLNSVQWGTLWPGITLLTVVAFGYMIISPIINGLACATFFLFYFLYKYLFVWQLGQPTSSDTGGLFFPKAIQHVFVGLYVQQVCLCALLFLARDQNGHEGAIWGGALMVVLIVITVMFHLMIDDSYGPLIKALPLTLADKTYGTADPAEEDTGPIPAPSQVGAVAAVSKARDFARAKGIEVRKRITHHHGHDDAGEEVLGDGLVSRTAEEYGYTPPAASRPQRVVWLPLDPLGLARGEERANRESGVACAVQDATMSEAGKVEVQGPPPDEVVA